MTTPNSSAIGARRLCAGVFLASLATLLLELSLTRIFSVSFHYHLSFLVVSLAMLGLGASGVIVSIRPPVQDRARMGARLAHGAIVFAAGSVLAVATAFHMPMSIEESASNWMRLLVIYALCVVPFAAGGYVVALSLAYETRLANRIYAFDLVGAALACAAFVPAANLLGPPTTVLAGAGLMAGAGAVFAGREAAGTRRFAAAVAGVFLIAALVNIPVNFFDVRVVKGKPQGPTVAVKWNAFSRVEVSGRPEDLMTPRVPLSYGYSSTLDPQLRVREALLLYDADALTQITRLDGDPSRLTYLGYDVTSAAYHMRRQRNVLVIGAGGGRDVLTALSLGSGPVTGVEVNPLTIRLMRGQFRDFSGGLYTGYPGVTAVNEEGRNFLRHTDARYELIQASLVDTWAASAAGAYALTENNLYTVEAFQTFLERLTPDGVLSLSRWFGRPLVEPLRLVTLGIEALRREGVTDPHGHFFIVRTEQQDTGLPSMGTVLLRRAPFTADELERLREWAVRMRFVVEFSPDAPPGGPGVFQVLLDERGPKFVAGYPFDITPVTDDIPFFFDRVPLLPWMMNRLGMARTPIGGSPLTAGGQTLLATLVVSGACTALLLVLPYAAARRRPDLVPAPRLRVAAWTIYFACLGLGFINVELVLLQRLNLFLGYPIYALAVVLFTLLLASGAGSALADRWTTATGWPRALAALCVLLVLAAFAVPALIHAALGASTPMRLMLAVLAVAPLGLVMGTAFPLGLRRANEDGPGLVPWAWAVNGAASVFGSALTVLLSMSFGFTVSFRAGIAAYAVAAVIAWRLSSPAAVAPKPVPRQAGP